MKSKMQLKINELEMALGLTPTLNIHIDEILSHPLELNSSFDSSLYIGDNLAYLRSFAETTPNIIDLCYIDPPYNTGNKFI
ncbi:site-specific DNA-methyltransferase, partial [Salmonella enterica subsp. enterica serovar Muenchen]|nr:site-specific DNA-methyltransferase [Salmonella enterica subsp. enterica serovar Muenchen]